MVDPLILTLAVDDALFKTLNALRQNHFPPELNFIPAHISLFHHLPGEMLAGIQTHLHAVSQKTPQIELTLPTLRSLGRGVAINIARSQRLQQLHADLAATWNQWLTPQDRQPFAPHITIQNKTDNITAKATLAHLSKDWAPLTGSAVGIDLWHYRGRPWEWIERFHFSLPSTQA